MNLNKVLLVGRITANPEVKKTQGGTSVSSFSVATNRVWYDKTSGKKNEETEFHNVVAWGKQAETICSYMTKGSEILVEGRLTTRKWKDKQGVERRTTEIVLENFQFGAKPKNAVSRDSGDDIVQIEGPEQEGGLSNIGEDDFPFQ